MANTGKSSRRSRRRRRRRSHQKSAETRPARQKPKPRRNTRTDEGSGELPEVFIYTYTIYKALE